MNDLPLVSIGIPAYNHECYVQECIQSIIDQDYPRIELIVIDDGSKDKTWDKVQEMRPACERRFERVVMQTQPNQGTAVTCRRLLSECRGKYFGAIASDDKYCDGAISKLVGTLENDSRLGLVVGKNIIIDENSRRCYWTEDRKVVYDENNADYCTFDDFLEKSTGIDFHSDRFGTYEEILRRNHIANGCLMRMECLRQIVPYSDKAPLEDWWLHLQLSKIASYRHIDDETFAYRWHSSNTMRNSSYINRIANETRYYEACQLRLMNNARWKKSFVGLVLKSKLLFRVPHIMCLWQYEMIDKFIYRLCFGPIQFTVGIKEIK